MDQRQAPEFTIPRKNSVGTAKRPKVTKSYSTPANATGRGGKRGGGASAASTSKTGRGGGAGSRGSARGNPTRGRGRGSGTGTGVGGGRKLSLQRQQLTSSQRTQESTVTTPAPSASPSTPRDAYFSIPPTPSSELDQYILHDNDLAEAGTSKVNDNKGEGEEEEDADDELGGTANAEWSQTRSKEELK